MQDVQCMIRLRSEKQSIRRNAVDALKQAQELDSKISELQKQKDSLRDAARAQCAAEVDAVLKKFGLTMRDIKPTSNVAVAYRGPNGEEWSGRGKRPKWVNDAVASGKDLADFKAG